MTFVKRLLSVAIGTILLIVAVCWGYWMYRQYQANQTPIPRDATSVIRIHVDGLIRDIAWNALWNRTDEQETTEQRSTVFQLKQWKQLGIQIPASLYIYQVDHARSKASPDVYFGSVVVDDSAAFTTWLHEKLGMKISHGAKHAMASSGHALVVIQSERALFALSPTELQADLTSLADLLVTGLPQHSDHVPVSESAFHEIVHDSGQISGRGTSQFSIDFKKGRVAVNSWHHVADVPGRLENTPHFADSNTASLWAQGVFTTFLAGKSFNLGDHVLHGDSLLAHGNGPLAMEWKDTVTQQDTVVNFEYDDNFELVETQEFVDKSVPEIYFSIRADTGLTDYLRAQGILDTPGNTIDRDVLPLFRLGVSTLPSGYVQFHTASAPLVPPTLSDRPPALLYLLVDFNKLQLPDVPTDFVPYLQAMDRFELSGLPISANEVSVRGTLRMKDPRVHSFVQLLRLLN